MLAAISFSKDANELALAPLERMIDKVNQIAKNPLIAKELKLAKQ
jgi:class 3 adenylate cyclase